MTFDPVLADNPDFDAVYSPFTTGVDFTSAGETLFGAMHVAQGKGQHPTVLLLHGFPGNERNLDIAHALRRAGWNALFFSYRGSWGSHGDFAFQHVLEDAQTALSWLRGERAITEFRVDPNRIALLGFSMGGWASIMTAAVRQDLLGAVSIAPWNIGTFAMSADADDESRQLAREWLSGGSKPLRGVTPDTLLESMLAHKQEWDLIHYAPALTSQHLLLIAGAEDEEVPNPTHFNPLVKALQATNAQHLTTKIIENADHSFAGQRIELTRIIVEWMQTL